MVPADSDRVSRARSYSGAVVGSTSAFAYGAFTLFGRRFHTVPLAVVFVTSRPTCGSITDGPTTPHRHRPAGRSFRCGLGSSRFARHYSGSRDFFPFLGLLRCFSSPAYRARPYVFRPSHVRITARRFPHSDIPASSIGQHLHRAYRSRPRPSSALSAKASTVCPCSLDRKEHVCCHYGVFKVRASWSARQGPQQRSLKTQQRDRSRSTYF